MKYFIHFLTHYQFYTILLQTKQSENILCIRIINMLCIISVGLSTRNIIILLIYSFHGQNFFNFYTVSINKYEIIINNHWSCVLGVALLLI